MEKTSPFGLLQCWKEQATPTRTGSFTAGRHPWCGHPGREGKGRTKVISMGGGEATTLLCSCHKGEQGWGIPSLARAQDQTPILCQDEPWDAAAPLCSQCQEGGCIGPLHPNQAASDPDQRHQTPPRPLAGLMPGPQHGLGRQRGAQHPRAAGAPQTSSEGLG